MSTKSSLSSALLMSTNHTPRRFAARIVWDGFAHRSPSVECDAPHHGDTFRGRADRCEVVRWLVPEQMASHGPRGTCCGSRSAGVFIAHGNCIPSPARPGHEPRSAGTPDRCQRAQRRGPTLHPTASGDCSSPARRTSSLLDYTKAGRTPTWRGALRLEAESARLSLSIEGGELSLTRRKRNAPTPSCCASGRLELLCVEHHPQTPTGA